MGPVFDRVPAKTLVLWKVSVSDVDSLQKLTDVEFANEVSLSPMDTLSEVFSDVPKKKHLHIIVKPPSIGKFPCSRVPCYHEAYDFAYCVSLPLFLILRYLPPCLSLPRQLDRYPRFSYISHWHIGSSLVDLIDVIQKK